VIFLFLLWFVFLVFLMFYFTRAESFAPFLAAMVLLIASVVIFVIAYEPDWKKDRREVKEQIEDCVDRGGTPIFALDDSTAEFFDCQEDQ
jgi:putative effector of murein hydrolase